MHFHGLVSCILQKFKLFSLKTMMDVLNTPPPKSLLRRLSFKLLFQRLSLELRSTQVWLRESYGGSATSSLLGVFDCGLIFSVGMTSYRVLVLVWKAWSP